MVEELYIMFSFEKKLLASLYRQKSVGFIYCLSKMINFCWKDL